MTPAKSSPPVAIEARNGPFDIGEKARAETTEALRRIHRPHLSRNMNGDFLLIVDGRTKSIVATCGSDPWYAIMDFATESGGSAPEPDEVNAAIALARVCGADLEDACSDGSRQIIHITGEALAMYTRRAAAEQEPFVDVPPFINAIAHIDLVDRLLEQAGYTEDSSARHHLALARSFSAQKTHTGASA